MILRVVGILHSWPTPFSVLLMVYWSGRAAKSGKAWEHMNDVGGCEVRGMTHSQFSMSWNSSSSSWLGLSDPLQVQTLDAIDNIHLTSRDEWSQTLFFATVPLPCYFFFNTNWRTENGIGGGHSINSCEQLKCGMYWSDHHLCMSTLEEALTVAFRIHVSITIYNFIEIHCSLFDISIYYIGNMDWSYCMYLYSYSYYDTIHCAGSQRENFEVMLPMQPASAHVATLCIGRYVELVWVNYGVNTGAGNILGNRPE